MVRDIVQEIEDLRQKAKAIEAEIDAKIDTLYLALVGESPDAGYSREEVFEQLEALGVHHERGDINARLDRLATQGRIHSTGVRYKAAVPEVLKRQLKESEHPK